MRCVWPWLEREGQQTKLGPLEGFVANCDKLTQALLLLGFFFFWKYEVWIVLFYFPAVEIFSFPVECM